MKTKNMNAETPLSFDTLLSYLMGNLSPQNQAEVESILAVSQEAQEMRKDIDYFINQREARYEDLLESNFATYENVEEVLYRHYELSGSREDELSHESVDPLHVLNRLRDDPRMQSIFPYLHRAVSDNLASTVAIQGYEGCFHEIAARKFLGESLSFNHCESFPKLMDELEQGHANYGVMAIENSVAGSILGNYELLRNSSYQVVGEVYLRIEHNLMALPGQDLSSVREVHSHPMALMQCQQFFNDIHPDAKMIERDDTAGSAKWIRDTLATGVAAIASKQAARIYGLEIIAPGIETNKRNFTRFLILMEKSRAAHYQRVRNKATLCFEVADRIGNLADILMVLKSHDLNLAKIQSSPILGREWQYFLHIDIEFDDYPQYLGGLDAISRLVEDLKIIGEYERGVKYGIELPEQDPEARDRLPLSRTK